jgi:hypothetical protein
MANHVVVNLDKVAALAKGNLTNVVYGSDMDNGSFVKAETLVVGSTEEFVAELCSTPTTDLLVLVHTPEFQADLYLPGKTLKDFYNPANKAARGIYLQIGDIITITNNGIVGSTTVGQYAVPAAGSLFLNAAADLSGGTRLALKVIDKTNGFSYTGSTYVKEPASILLVVKV